MSRHTEDAARSPEYAAPEREEPEDLKFGRGLLLGAWIGAVFWAAVFVTLFMCGWGDGL